MEHISFWLMMITLIFWEKMQIPYKNTGAVLDASKEIGLEMNSEKTTRKYMLMSCCKNAGQKHSIKIANKSFEDVANIWEQP
jgi:hypothetical protein